MFDCCLSWMKFWRLTAVKVGLTAVNVGLTAKKVNEILVFDCC